MLGDVFFNARAKYYRKNILGLQIYGKQSDLCLNVVTSKLLLSVFKA